MMRMPLNKRLEIMQLFRSAICMPRNMGLYRWVKRTGKWNKIIIPFTQVITSEADVHHIYAHRTHFAHAAFAIKAAIKPEYQSMQRFSTLRIWHSPSAMALQLWAYFGRPGMHIFIFIYLSFRMVVDAHSFISRGTQLWSSPAVRN